MELKDEKGKVIAKVTAADPNNTQCDGGVWVELQADDGTRPTLCIVKGRPGDYSSGWYVGVYRDGRARDVGQGCDLAVSFDPQAGPVLQVRQGDQAKIVNLFDLLAKIA